MLWNVQNVLIIKSKQDEKFISKSSSDTMNDSELILSDDDFEIRSKYYNYFLGYYNYFMVFIGIFI